MTSSGTTHEPFEASPPGATSHRRSVAKEPE